MIRETLCDVAKGIDSNKVSTVFCDICDKARIVNRFEVDARVFEEENFPWKCTDLARIGTCRKPDDELVAVVHNSDAIACLLEEMGVRNRKLLAEQNCKSLFTSIRSKVGPTCTDRIYRIIFAFSHFSFSYNFFPLLSLGTLALCTAFVMKARREEIREYMDSILQNCDEHTKNVLSQCEVLTPQLLLSWKPSALAMVLQTQSSWQDGKTPTESDVESWQRRAKLYVQTAPWLEEHKFPPDLKYV